MTLHITANKQPLIFLGEELGVIDGQNTCCTLAASSSCCLYWVLFIQLQHSLHRAAHPQLKLQLWISSPPKLTAEGLFTLRVLSSGVSQLKLLFQCRRQQAGQTGPTGKQLSLQVPECPECHNQGSFSHLLCPTRAKHRKEGTDSASEQVAGQEKSTEPGRGWEGRRDVSGEESV